MQRLVLLISLPAALLLASACGGTLEPEAIEPAPTAALAPTPTSTPAPTPTPAPPASRFSYDEFRILPLRIHLLHSETVTDLNALSTDDDIVKVLAKINGIWSQAGIQFFLKSMIRETVINEFAYTGFKREVPLPMLGLLRPRGSQGGGMFHVYYLHDFQANGVFIPGVAIFVKELSELREVDGGSIDLPPMARVTGHELGHGLGLTHLSDADRLMPGSDSKLMADATTGTFLDDEDILTARQGADLLGWNTNPQVLLEGADTAFRDGHVKTAEVTYQILAGIPGDSPVKIQAQEGLARVHELEP